jgi:LacI family transcriptional regulator
VSVTIRDVAREAGVSIQTVSSVLNGRHGVASETRRRVRETIEQLGFHPSDAARSLRSGRSRTVGLLIGDVSNPYYAELSRGAEDAARARGYSMIFGSTEGQLDRISHLVRIFQDRRVAGIVSSAGLAEPRADHYFEQLSAETPLVQLGRPLPSALLPQVVVDDLRGGYVAASHIISLGRRRVALITGPLRTRPGQLRLEGYKSALGDWHLPVLSELIIEGDFTYQSGYDAATRLAAVRPAIDGIVAGNDLTAIGAIACLKRAGLRVPDDIAVIGYDDAEIGRLYDPPISTISQPKYQLGFRGVSLLLDRIEAIARDPEGRAPEPIVEQLDCELVVRRSSIGHDEEIRCGSIQTTNCWEACLKADLDLASAPTL